MTVSEGEGTPPGIAIPEVRNVGCEDGDPHQLVSDSVRQGRRVIAVCTNRVQALSRSAEAEARDGRAAAQEGNARALQGLTGARRDLLANTGMGGEDRQRALAAINGAIASLRPEAPGR